MEFRVTPVPAGEAVGHRKPRWTWLLLPLALALWPALPGRAGDGSSVSLSQVELPSLPLPARVRALEALAVEVAQRTSIETDPRARTLSVLSPDLFNHPLLFLPCNSPLPLLSEEEEGALANWLKIGGTLFVDWQGGGSGVEQFRTSVEQFVSVVFPGAGLERIPRANVVYRSFYRLKYASGRVRLVDDLYGVMVDGRFAILVSFNDMLSAAERGQDGKFRYDVMPGGATQREDAIRGLVNIIAYALCLDYKNDKVHLEYLRSKRNWRLPGD